MTPKIVQIDANSFKHLCKMEAYVSYLKQMFPSIWNKLLSEIDDTDLMEYSKIYTKH